MNVTTTVSKPCMAHIEQINAKIISSIMATTYIMRYHRKREVERERVKQLHTNSRKTLIKAYAFCKNIQQTSSGVKWCKNRVL